ncbi:MAG: SRPBCC family protein [Gemmatimonadota bacterium]|nr:SRPBCC family protein [Gemmatimonadota bacterium]
MSHEWHDTGWSGYPPREGSREERERSMKVGTALGIFSIGLGLAEIVAPRALARLIGIRPSARTSTTMRVFGLREMATGVGMLLQPERPEWAWARVAGDAVDLSALVGSARGARNNGPRIAAITVATAGIAALNVMHARQLGGPRIKRSGNRQNGIRVRRSVTINRPTAEVYDFWRDFENLPLFMQHLESVIAKEGNISHWVAKAPAGTTVEWDAELTQEVPNELLAWRSVDGATVPNSGTVRFTAAPGDRGTEVHVDLQYSPPGGMLSALIAKLFGEEPALQVADDLRRFKQVLETGEVLVSDASVHAGMHAAQPSDDEPDNPPETERSIVVERVADAQQQSSNRDRESSRPEDTRAQAVNDERYNNELANERSTF